VPAAAHPESDFIVSSFMERVYGSRVATLFTPWSLDRVRLGVRAALGYSRIRTPRPSTGPSSRRSPGCTVEADPARVAAAHRVVAIAASALSLAWSSTR